MAPRRGSKGHLHTPEWKAAASARQNKWTVEELNLLREWYAEHEGKKLELVKLGLLLHRNRHVISRKARELGLTKRSRLTGRKPKNKYATVEEARAAIGPRMRAWVAANGHPRGALGLRHTEASRLKMGMASREFQVTLTPEQWVERSLKATATKLARYGTAGPALWGVKVFSRAKSGSRDDLGGRYFRSMWEANYARYLNFLQNRRLIISWDYESRTFRFEGITRGCMTYTPDFEVTKPDGSVEYHEVKGWMDPKSRTRLDRMARYHPDVPLLLIDKTVYYEIAKKLGGAIPGWEKGS